MKYNEKYPIDNSPNGDEVREAVLKNRNEILEVAKTINEYVGGNTNGKSQQVLSGASINGEFNFLTANGLEITIDGTIKPVIIAFASGYNVNGAVDFVEQIVNKVNSWIVSANNSTYLYVDRSITTGAISYGSSTQEPVYSKTAPNAVLDLHWFNETDRKMYVYNGTEWQEVQRVFIAMVTADSTTVKTFTYIQPKITLVSGDNIKDGTVSESELTPELLNKIITALDNANYLLFDRYNYKTFTAYKIRDIARPKGLDSKFILECVVAGTTSNANTWGWIVDEYENYASFPGKPPANKPRLIQDGTVVWQVRKAYDEVPVGTILTELYVPKGYVLLDGSTVPRDVFPRLVNLANEYGLWTDNTSGYRGLFGKGNGSTTMVLPNLHKSFTMHDATIIELGKYYQQGLPNITGVIAMHGAQANANGGTSVEQVNGAFSGDAIQNNWWSAQTMTGTTSIGTVVLNANKLNPIYGRHGNEYVLPETVKAFPCMKY